jgi:hypothetical protein
MKRKLMMMSFAMMSGLPQAVCAGSSEKGGLSISYASWNGDYMPHYGSEGAAHPLMEHLTATIANGQDAGPNKWRLEFAMPRVDMMGAQDQLPTKGGAAGVSLKLNF